MNDNYQEINLESVPENSSGNPEPPAPKNDGATGKTVAALILGITSVVLGVTVVLGIFGLACGVIGLIFSIREKKEHPTGMATASFILSLIGLVTGVLSAVACVGCIGFFSLIGTEYYYNPYDYYEFFDTIQYF
ncbi:MAG: hypothetical protein ACI3W6_00265 [Clostridia bacterium]